ncbi:MAG: class I SAM-dependent methyltransferase [Sandaracinaceae bacterium]
MRTFAADWLALREPVDHRTRSRVLEARLRLSLQGKSAIHVVDLAAGTGSNLRHLAPSLTPEQSWRLVDQDARLLGEARRRLARWADGEMEVEGSTLRLAKDGRRLEVRLEEGDLGADLEPVLAGAELVTASALLDLVSDDWLQRLARAASCPVLLALTYDGRARWSPPRPFDDAIREAVGRHQRSDKGFGEALGPEAAKAARRAFQAEAMEVHGEASDWRLGPGDAALQLRFAAGWRDAALEEGSLSQGDIAVWWRARRGVIEAGRSYLVVGHRELLALPPSRTSSRVYY